ncbi:DUF3450 family protein [[Phormidium] sp. ETS-05]|uniref:DUF3450 family protein n=1 Tax=[Phormidium] sp. ETS-05 TaxID=222819 RepID=UPI0018EF1440|nr:DUF3450 family protein [[Phormidium] sp. ETS-05]
MTITASSAAAVGLAALLAASGFAYIDARNQLDKTEDRLTTTQTERDQLTKQVDDLQQQVKDLEQQVSSGKTSVSDLQGQLGDRERAIAAFDGQIDTLSTCLQGVVEGMSEMSNGDQAAALLTFSSVSATCRQADKIIEQRNSNNSGTSYGQGQSLTTRSSF